MGSVRPGIVHIAADARNELAEWLKGMGCEVVRVESDGIVSAPLANHPDIFMCKLGFDSDAPVLYQRNCVTQLGKKYPEDIAFNAACTGRYFIHALKYTAPELLERAKGLGMELVNTRQGYTKCSIVVVDETSVITYDEGIAAPCRAAGMNVLKVSPGHVLLPGYDTGFIGGASGRIGDTIVFNGDLSAHPDYEAIREFIEARGLGLKWFDEWPLTDIGSII